MVPETLYVFIDESGNFDFSPKGTRHFVMSAVYTTRPGQSANQMSSLKYQLLSEGVDIPSFHATNDSQYVRDQVFSNIRSMENLEAIAVFGSKSEIPFKLQNSLDMYVLFSKYLVSRILETTTIKNAKNIIFILDQALPKVMLNQVTKSIKNEIKVTSVKFQILFHSMKSDFNSQIADYCCWAYYVYLERKELRPLNQLQLLPRYRTFNIKKLP